MTWTRPARGFITIGHLALSWMMPCYSIGNMPRTTNKHVLSIDGKLAAFLARGEIPAAPFCHHYSRCILALEWRRVGSRRSTKAVSFLNFINSINLQGLIETTFIFPSISEVLLFPLPCCHFKTADVRVPATSLIRIFCQ